MGLKDDRLLTLKFKKDHFETTVFLIALGEIIATAFLVL